MLFKKKFKFLLILKYLNFRQEKKSPLKKSIKKYFNMDYLELIKFN